MLRPISIKLLLFRYFLNLVFELSNKNQINYLLQNSTYLKQTTFKLSVDIRNWIIADEIIKQNLHTFSDRLIKYSHLWFRLMAETSVFSNHIELR